MNIVLCTCMCVVVSTIPCGMAASSPPIGARELARFTLHKVGCGVCSGTFLGDNAARELVIVQGDQHVSLCHADCYERHTRQKRMEIIDRIVPLMVPKGEDLKCMSSPKLLQLAAELGSHARLVPVFYGFEGKGDPTEAPLCVAWDAQTSMQSTVPTAVSLGGCIQGHTCMRIMLDSEHGIVSDVSTLFSGYMKTLRLSIENQLRQACPGRRAHPQVSVFATPLGAAPEKTGSFVDVVFTHSGLETLPLQWGALSHRQSLEKLPGVIADAQKGETLHAHKIAGRALQNFQGDLQKVHVRATMRSLSTHFNCRLVKRPHLELQNRVVLNPSQITLSTMYIRLRNSRKWAYVVGSGLRAIPMVVPTLKVLASAVSVAAFDAQAVSVFEVKES